VKRPHGLLPSRNMRIRVHLAILCLVATSSSVEAERIFRSGFEGNTSEKLKFEPPRIDRLLGQDTSVPPPNHWENDLQAQGRGLWFNYVDHKDGVNPEMLGARIVRDPKQPNNRVFYAWQKRAEYQRTAYSRVQGELTKFDWPEFYYKVRFRLGGDIAHGNRQSHEDLSLSLIEVGGGPGFHLCRLILHKWGNKHSWNNGKAPLRWRSEVGTPKSGHTFFKSSGVKAIFNTWQALEFYAKAGDETTGRYWAAIDGKVLFDETVKTKDAGNWTNAGILKSYGGPLVNLIKDKGGTHEVWFDDVEIWNSFPPKKERLNSR